ncbi:MAG: tRNA delta(2)-isopentenylpyrophosphate transferase [Enterovirga sp.]|jgi:hypothetical protein|nr:tRNA delta(2)-isopentenylpyrophosphate transferase [Enterovirga sp.]
MTKAVLTAAALVVGCAASPAAEVLPERVGTALILAVDVSGSVDAERFGLQRDGIADALSDPAVQNVLLAPAAAPLVVAVVTWADRARIAIPWTQITDREAAAGFAARVRKLQRTGESFTCVAAMLGFIANRLLPSLPPARRVIVDVSGDGSENCNPPSPPAERRDQLVALGATINGLPILEGREAATLESWYGANVIGGDNAFTIAAADFSDVGRAMRLKFTAEISGAEPPALAIRLAQRRRGPR